ncbi:MAG TPA: hypothetical protein VKV15_10910 [Bryobacteraceae bacterium]|nr:hypothetical protein [Bryobacteraceae bacterium]
MRPRILDRPSAHTRYGAAGTDFVDIITRLKPGVTLAAAQTELNVIARRPARAYPDDDKALAFGAELRVPLCLRCSGQ